MNIVDSRDLIEESNELKQQILESFLENFPQYEDMTESFEDIRFEEEEIQSWKEDWLDEIVTITDIEELEDEVGSEWCYGVALIDEDDFEDYCQEFVEDCGYISKDTPQLIKNNIDWAGIAYDMGQDYSEVVYNDITYLYR
jgi:predicted nuclease with TOPRIM domain